MTNRPSQIVNHREMLLPAVIENVEAPRCSPPLSHATQPDSSAHCTAPCSRASHGPEACPAGLIQPSLSGRDTPGGIVRTEGIVMWRHGPLIGLLMVALVVPPNRAAD